MKVQDLLSSKDKWTYLAFARNKNGYPVSERSSKAVCFCLLGAINKCYRDPDERLTAINKLSEVINTLISRWNDTPGRTFKQVRRAIEKADI